MEQRLWRGPRSSCRALGAGAAPALSEPPGAAGNLSPEPSPRASPRARSGAGSTGVTHAWRGNGGRTKGLSQLPCSQDTVTGALAPESILEGLVGSPRAAPLARRSLRC